MLWSPEKKCRYETLFSVLFLFHQVLASLGTFVATAVIVILLSKPNGFFWFQYLRPTWDYIDSDFLIKWNCLLDIGKDLLIQLKFYFSHFFLQILLFTTQQVYYLLFYKYVIYPSINLLVTSSWFQITSTHSWILLM